MATGSPKAVLARAGAIVGANPVAAAVQWAGDLQRLDGGLRTVRALKAREALAEALAVALAIVAAELGANSRFARVAGETGKAIARAIVASSMTAAS
jgi:hypothetical protein